MEFFRKALRKIKLVVLYFTRIVFVRNKFKVNFFTKIRMNICGGYLADQYVLYDFRHKDRHQYLSEFDWYRSRYINEPFDFAFNNKVVCSEILKHYIKTPENYFVKNKGILYDFVTGPVTNDDVMERLRENGKLFIKPFASGKGNGVHLMRYDGSGYLLDEKPCGSDEMEAFLTKHDGYIICEFIQQDEFAAGLFDKTVNTIRLITMRNNETHRFEIPYAVQRIGRAKTVPVDNGSKGGLVAKIDIATGALSYARSLHDLESYPVHPDSGAQIEGAVIPGWDRIKEEILDVCRRIPYMEFIAWDLVPTDDGLCMIEANTSSGVNILQLWGGQKNEVLGDFFRHYGVIK